MDTLLLKGKVSCAKSLIQSLGGLGPFLFGTLISLLVSVENQLLILRVTMNIIELFVLFYTLCYVNKKKF